MNYTIGNVVLELNLCISILISAVLGFIIGLERKIRKKEAGIRTHTILCLGSCLMMVISCNITQDGGFDKARIAAQIVSGIGFLGVGTILLKGRFQITGLTTAAGLWCAAAIGIALGAGFYEGAIITFVCSVLTVTIISRIEHVFNKRYSRFGIYVEICSDKYVRATVDLLESKYKIWDIQVTAPRSGTSGNVGIEANVLNHDFSTTPDQVARELEVEEYVIFALESI